MYIFFHSLIFLKMGCTCISLFASLFMFNVVNVLFCFVLFYLSKLLVNQGFVLATLSPTDMVVPSGKGFV